MQNVLFVKGLTAEILIGRNGDLCSLNSCWNYERINTSAVWGNKKTIPAKYFLRLGVDRAWLVINAKIYIKYVGIYGN